jgi:hypothetical protein
MAARRLRRSESGQEFTKEIRNRQRNIVWPGPQVNNRLVGGLLWKGSRDATVVQRIGLAIFGLTYLLAGLIFLSIAKGERSVWLAMFALPWLLLGVRVLNNALRKRQIDRPSQ